MSGKLQRVIFTCGGTAGHVNPAVALAQLLGRQESGAEVLFVGSDRGLEKDLVPKAGYEFRTVHISSFHRSFAPREIRHNLISVYNLMRAPGRPEPSSGNSGPMPSSAPGAMPPFPW